jgi:uncharacterized membrane protein YedE/YeeE
MLKRSRWSPYLVGALIGVLSWITFAAMGKALGTSTTMVRIAGAIESAAVPEHADQNAYFAKYRGTAEKPKPVVEWQFALVVFMVVGAFLAAKLGGTLRGETVPALWAQRFGGSRLKRWLGAFLGGLILLFGARLAGGCTSGHGLSGGLQLAVGSWIFTGAMFATGIVTALALFGRKG